MSPRGWCISSCSFLVDFPAFVGLSAGPGRRKSAKNDIKKYVKTNRTKANNACKKNYK